MTKLSPRLKSLLIAFVALVLSAGAVFAGSAPSTGLSTAAVAAGKTVPVQAQPGGSDQDEDADQDTDADQDKTDDATDETDSSDSADNCSTDPTGLTAEQRAAMTHGSIVCWAAHQETPDGYANHGAFVSEWAKKGTGGEAASADSHAAAGLSHKGQGKSHRP